MEVFGHLLPFRAAFSTFSSLESTSPQGTNISKGEAEGETSDLQRGPVRAEAAEGRRGDSKERKGEKEGKDRDRKVSLGWKVLHTFGLPRWKSSPMAAGMPVPAWAGNPVGFARGIPARNAEELPSLSLGIWSLPLHQRKKMMGKNKRKGDLFRWFQCQ